MKTGSRYRERASPPGRLVLGFDWAKLGTELIYNYEKSRDFTTNQVKPRVERCWDETNPGPPYLTGGPFLSIKHEADWLTLAGQGSYKYPRVQAVGGLQFGYTGGFVPDSFGQTALSYDAWKASASAAPETFQNADASPHGAEAWNRYRPKLNAADVAVTLGELRELPRMLEQTAKDFHRAWRYLGGDPHTLSPKRAADTFLNLNFGWFPFVSDVHKIYNAHQNVSKNLQQMRRDNGRWIKRSGTFSFSENRGDINNHEGSTYPLVWPPLSGHLIQSRSTRGSFKYGTTTTYKDEKSRVWFEGQFKYWLPTMQPKFDGDRVARAVEMANYYGLRISPTAVWNLTPWSWLSDWFSNAGDVVDNITAANYDHLVAKYAFVMKHTQALFRNDSTIFLKPEVGPDINMSWSMNIESKHRVSADPFGFSLSDAPLSVKQLMILTALGLSGS